MVDDRGFYELLLGLLWLCVLLDWLWSWSQAATAQAHHPAQGAKRRAKDQNSFPGLIHKPHCAACDHVAEPHSPAPCAPPPPLTFTRGRRRAIDARSHFCPNLECSYYGWVRRGNIRSNGHPGGGSWRQLHCIACGRYFQETHGTPLHGKCASAELIVCVIACLAEGLGIRGTARVFEVDPNTVLQWLVEAAQQLQAFARHTLHDVRVQQVQLDELFALLSAVKDGAVSEAEALARLERSPQWVWVAMDPESKLLLALDVGARTLALAQRLVHQVAQVLAPDCVPLFLTDGFREYMTALLTHYGQWVQPPRRQAIGPLPKPRWLPLPQLLYAQVVKTVWRRRLVRVYHRVVFGTPETVNAVLAPLGCQINPAFIERLNLTIRHHGAAVGRRVTTLCKREEGLRQQLALSQVYYNFCLPPASLRVPLPQPLPTNGTGSAQQWRPQTPAMAAGLTDRVWTLREVLLFRVPPWPQPAMV